MPREKKSRPEPIRLSGDFNILASCEGDPRYNFSKKSHAEHEMYMPPGISRSRSLTRFTTRVALPHLGQSVLLVVSMTFLRSAVFAIFAIRFS